MWEIMYEGKSNLWDAYINYSVDGEWKIIDVYLNGTVSELALRRSEYSSLIQREGLDSLIVALNQKITNLSESTPADQGP